MNITVGYDAAHKDLPEAEKLLPPGSLFAGYDTGSPDIVWTPADRARHPGSLHIDQDTGASDFTSDYLDVEGGAATPAQAPHWYSRAFTEYLAGTRPGQRHPSIYMSASLITETVNSLISGGVKSGPGLVVANWNLSEPQAVQDVVDAAGPFPIVGVQFRNQQGIYDINVFSGDWLARQSARAPAPAVPPGQWKDASQWAWKDVTVVGTGLDGHLYMWEYNEIANTWKLIAL